MSIGPTSYKELILNEYKKCMESPVYFMKHYVKIKHPIRGTILFDLFKFQEETLEAFHDHKFNIILKSRQMGISTLVAAYSLWMMIFFQDKTVLLISLRQNDAKDVVAKVRDAYQELPAWLKVKCLEDNRLSMKFSNGSSISAASTTKKSGVGQALSLLIIDEAALIDDAEELWTSAQPTLSCLDKSQLILTERGLMRLEQLINNQTKIGFNDIVLRVHDGDELVCASSFYMSEKSDLYEVKFKSGGRLVATKNHPLMTKNGWKSVDNIEENKDFVLCKYNQNVFGKAIDFSKFVPDIRIDSKRYDISPTDTCYLAGLWTAEGHFSRGTVGITNTDEEIINWLKSLGFKNSDERHYYIQSMWVQELLKWIGCEGTAHTKRVPTQILSASQEEQVAFLQGLFDGDGCSMGAKGIKLTSVSYELLSNVRAMLLNMGINSYIRDVTWKSTKSTVIKDKTQIFYGFELFVGGFDAHSFYSTVGFRLKRKQEGWQKLSRKSIKRIFPDKTLVKNLILESGMSIRDFSKKHNCFYDRYLWYNGKGLSITSVETLLDVSNKLHPSENYKLLKKQYEKDTSEFFDEVVSIRYLRNDFSYDLKVPAVERFVCEGYVNHNTGGNAIVLSTPRGVGNWFHKMWQGAEAENRDNTVGKNGFHPITLPWHLHPERNEEWRRVEGEKQGNPKKASQEYDCNFLASGDNVIDLNIIEFYKKNKATDPLECRGMDKNLWIWEYPDRNHTYVIAADVARGDGADYSACHVLDISREKPVQVAEYKGKIETKDFGDFLVALATEYNGCLLVIERENVGWGTLQEVIDRGYSNTFYSSTDLKYVEVQRQLSNSWGAEDRKLVPGFSTNIKTRPLIIDNMEHYMRQMAIEVRSKRTLAELETFIWKNGKAIAMEGYNDDLVMSLCIALWVRDTALRLRQEGMELTKLAVGGITSTKKDTTPVYKVKQQQVGFNSWKMNTGRQGFGRENQEDIRWLIS